MVLKFEEVVKTLKRFTVLWQRFIDDRHGQKKVRGERIRPQPKTKSRHGLRQRQK